MRKRIYEILHLSNKDDRIGHAYNGFLVVCIVISVIPLLFKKNYLIFNYTGKITLVVFLIDYFLRIITADLKLKKGLKSFLIYPFTFLAIADILSILPSMKIFTGYTLLHKNFKLLKLLKMVRIL